VVHGEEEGIGQYMARFTKATSDILDLHSVVVVHTLLIGLRSGKFLNTLYADPDMIPIAQYE